MMTRDEIWTVAYEIYTDPNRSESKQYNDMQRFLNDKVKSGELGKIEKFMMAREVMETADPYMAYELELEGI